ncbi:MAG: protein kinase [Vicinamibacteria bacterium]
MIGQTLAQYRITAALGAGGMGEVWRANDTKLGRDVALKLLPAALASDPDRLARFEREARVLASLNHPAIAHLYGFESATLPDGSTAHVLAMELVEGEDLAARLRRGAIPVDEAIDLARQVAEALEEAHEKGIVHRDLKPANVKVTSEGRVKVLDFGLAKAWSGEGGSGTSSAGLSQSPTLTHTGTAAGIILGTAAYMSPEQARARPVDKRADVWSFGVLLFEMLSGRRLFDGESVTDVLAAVVREPIAWDTLPAGTPPHVRRLLQRCLEREPKLRLRDVGEARIALAAPPVPEPSAGAGVSRRKALVLAAGAGAGALAAGFGLGRRFGREGAGRRAPLSSTRITSSGNVISATISPDGRFVAYVESEQGEQSLWLQQLATGQALRLIPMRPVAYWSHAFTRDGNSIVFGMRTPAEPKGAFYAISPLGGTPRRLVEAIDSAPTFSPDGRRMAWVRASHPGPEQSALMVANADGTDARVLWAAKLPDRVAPIFYTAPDWSPDGRRIACSVVRVGEGAVARRARIVAVSVADGTVETLADPGWRLAAQVAWMPDGRQILAVAAADEGPSERVWGVPLDGREPRLLTADVLQYRIVSLSSDGSSLVTIGGDTVASVWRASIDGRDRPRRITSSRYDGIYGLALSPDGRVVYSSDRPGAVGGLWVTSPDGAEQSRLPTGAGAVRSVAVTDRAEVFYVLRTASGSELRRVPLDGSAASVVVPSVEDSSFAVSPDGSVVLYVALERGNARLFRGSTAGGKAEKVSDEPAFIPAFSPDGRRVAYYFFDRAGQRFRIAIAPAAGGPPEKTLDVEPPANGSGMVFGQGELYLNTVPGDRANVWRVPLDGRAPQRVTDFQDGLLYSFDVSPDGRTLVYSRGPRTRDALLLRNFA